MKLLHPNFSAEDVEPDKVTAENIADMWDFLINTELGNGPVLHIPHVVTDDGDQFDNYEVVIVSKFTVGGDQHLGLADGFFINISEVVREMVDISEEMKKNDVQ